MSKVTIYSEREFTHLQARGELKGTKFIAAVLCVSSWHLHVSDRCCLTDLAASKYND